MIELENVSKHYKLAGDLVVKAVDNVTLRIERGEFAIIVGRSGSGKTTLLSLIGGLTKPTTGTVSIEGTDLWTLNDREQSQLRAEKIGFVFQIPSLLPTMTVIDNLRLPTMFSRKKEGAAEKATDLVKMVGLAEKVGAYPAQLSVGQQKRVALARALMNDPHILLADEPTSDLDKATELEMMKLVEEIHAEGARTILMVTHNLELARYATQVYMMTSGVLTREDGRVVIR